MLRTNFPPLDQVDPAQAWQPWQPDARQLWNLKWAAHLYRRAAFGANLAELREAVRQGHSATLDRLVESNPQADQSFVKFMVGTGNRIGEHSNAFQLRAWWLYGMVYAPNRLREKLTLFWHNHFATSIAKIRSPGMMGKQNQLLREYALGKFEPMLQAISKDPAMLVWLDSNSNVKGKPNENYAREVMELFSLGVGHYSEKDIREAARAFTGWHTDNDKFEFVAAAHDDGVKSVFGQTGNWNGDDIVRIVLKRDDAARFLVGKLYRAFISEHEPPAALLEPLADSFRKSDYDVGRLVKTMLRSRHFFSDHAYRQRVKDPVEYTLGTVFAVNGTVRALVPEHKNDFVQPVELVRQLDTMGQQLFAPPNVKGWPGGRTWLNTSTVLARSNFAQQVAGGTLHARPNEGRNGQRPELEAFQEEQERQQEEQRRQAEQAKGEEPPASPRLDVAVVVHAEKFKEPAQVVNLLLEMLLDGNTTAAARSRLTAYLAEGKPEGAALDRRIRATAHAIMAMPEYQLA